MRIRLIAMCLAALLGMSAMSALVAPSAAAAPTLPSGFRLIPYRTALGTYDLTNFDFTPDGGLLAVGKDGRVSFTPADAPPYLLGTVPRVRTVGDQGLLGMQLASDYADTGRIFLLYPQLDPDGSGNAHAVLSEWTASPPSRPTSLTLRRTIVDGSQTSPVWTENSRSHSIGTVVQASDGSLFVGNGDEASFTVVDPAALRTYDLNDPHGKILHILPDGRGDPANPFYDAGHPSSWRSRVFAYGFRNPFRFSIDPRSGALYVGDVGWATTEEIDVVTAGRNYGWPCYEGANRQSGYATLSQCQQLYAQPSQPAPPLWSVPHAGSGASIVGGVFYQGSAYPAAQRGAYFFGDYTRRGLWTLTTDSAGNLLRAPETSGFGADIGGPVAFRNGPNGDIAYADLLSGNVFRLVYSPGNRPPTAVISSSVDASSRTVQFSAEQSYDLDSDPLTYRWNFGDGVTASGMKATHQYASGGTFQVTLDVTDPLGATDQQTASVTPDNYSPTLAIDAPSHLFAVGELVSATARASDPEDGDLSAAVNWQLSLLHCPFAGSCHSHPQSTGTGPSFESPFTDHGSDTTMNITATVTDGKGATATQTYVAEPDLHTLFITSPVAVQVNGVEHVSTELVTGSTNSVAAPDAVSYWRFARWSDGGARIRDVIMPAADLTLTAEYQTAIQVRYAELGGQSSYLGAATSAEYDIPPGRGREYTGGRLYWSQATDVHAARGRILTRYLATGGPAKWGFPLTDEVAIAGGKMNQFQLANFYWTSTTDAHSVEGTIRLRYLATGGPAKWGFPLTDQVAIAGGKMNQFQLASFYYTKTTSAHFVRGGIRTRYLALGGPNSALKFPTTDEQATTYGARNLFQGGRIEWIRSTNTIRVIYT